MRRLANGIGFDDGAFVREARGDVPLIGVVCARTRVDGVVLGRVRRDGVNSTDVVGRLVRESPFYAGVQVVLLNGIAFGGFNVVDIARLGELLERPVLVVTRKAPDLERIRAALGKVRGGDKKWALIEKAGLMEERGGVWVQRVGLSGEEADFVLSVSRGDGLVPESLRVAHLMGGALFRGFSRGKV